MVLPMVVVVIGLVGLTSTVDIAANNDVAVDESSTDDTPLDTLKANKDKIQDSLGLSSEDVEGIELDFYIGRLENDKLESSIVSSLAEDEEAKILEAQLEDEQKEAEKIEKKKEQKAEEAKKAEEEAKKAEEEAKKAEEEALEAEKATKKAAKSKSSSSNSSVGASNWDADSNGIIDASKRQDLVQAAGISLSDFEAVDYIITHESSWNYTANNGYVAGLPQAAVIHSLPGDYYTNPVSQLQWADGYANSTYGGWGPAYSHWQSNMSW